MKLPHKPLLWVVVLSVGLVFILTTTWVVWRWDNLGAPAHPNFKGYTSPATLNGATFLTNNMTRIKEEGMDIWSFDYDLHYSSGIVVYERSPEHPERSAACKYQPNDTQGDYVYTCKEFPIKNGGQYIITTVTYKGELADITSAGLIGNTLIYIGIPTDKLHEFATYDGWQQYFDSLQPVNLGNMPFEQKTHSQYGG